MSRDPFLARIRDALGRAADAPVAPPPGVPQPSAAPNVESPEELPRLFRMELEAVGGRVLPVADMARARAAVREIVEGERAASWTRSVERDAEDATAGLDVPRAATHEAADVGITAARCAIAETGTIVLTSEGGRLASLLPMTWVAIVRAETIVPTLADALARFADPEDLPSAWVQVTGPSRTADIEMTLTTGVHGPGRVWAIVVGDERPS